MKHVYSQATVHCVETAGFTGGVMLHLPEGELPETALTDCVNMHWKDGALRSRRGWQCTDAVTGKTGALYLAPQCCVQDGRVGRRFIEKYTDGEGTEHRLRGVAWYDGTVQTVPTDADAETVTLMADIGGGDSMVFDADGVRLYGEDGQGQTAQVYIPTVCINGYGVESTQDLPAAAGTFFEEFNLLTPAWKETFTTDGKACHFFLTKRGVEAAITATYTASNGVEYTHRLALGEINEGAERGDGLRLTYNKTLGAVGLVGYPDASLRASAAGFAGNLTVTVMPEGAPDARILGMRQAVWYGGSAGGTRLFLSGNRACPNLVHWSAVGQASYFPENNYLYVGSADSAVTALARQSDRLIVFKEREIYALQYTAGQIDQEAVIQGTAGGVEAAAATFSLQPLHAEIGCTAPNSVVLCGGRLVFLSGDGRVCRLSGLTALNEGNVTVLSQAVSPWLEDVGQHACAFACDGQYLLNVGTDTLVLDGGDANFSALSAKSSAAWYRHRDALGVPMTAAAGSGSRAMRIGAVCGQNGYVRCVHRLAGDCDEAVGHDGGISASPVLCSWRSGLWRLGGGLHRLRIRRVRLQASGAPARVLCRTEEQARTALCAKGEGGTFCLLPADGEGVYFGLQAEAAAPWTVGRVQVSYQQTGKVR